MNKYIHRMEKTTSYAVYKALQKDKKEIQEYLRKIDEEKGFFGDLKEFVKKLAPNIVGAFLPKVKSTIQKGANDGAKKHKKKIPKFSVNFNLPAKPESTYLRALEKLHLSPYKGSINATTYNRLKHIIAKGTKKGLSYSQIADQIEKLDGQLFSKNRADLIAINQIGKAYEFGEYLPMKELWNEGYLVLKYWSTVNDNRVTKTHSKNQSDGWELLTHRFSGTGDSIPPGSDNPRCRCHIEYEVGDERGGKQSKEIQAKLESRKEKRKVRKYFKRLEDEYDYSKDTFMKNAMTNWKGSGPEFFHDLLDRKITEEEAVALFWWKGEQHHFINKTVGTFKRKSKYNGMAKNLAGAIDSLPRYKKTLWQGVSKNDVRFIEKLEKMKDGDIFTSTTFFPTSKKRSKAKEFGDEIILQINNPKTGGDLGKADEMSIQEYEVLFKPGVSFELTGKKGNIYFLNEI